MTLIVALANPELVVVGADSLQLHDNPDLPGVLVPEDGIQKIERLTNRAIVGLQGRSEFAPGILRRARAELSADDDVESAYEKCSDAAQKLYAKWFWHVKPSEMPETNILLAGVANEDGAPMPRILFMRSRYGFAREESDDGRGAFGRDMIARPLLNRLHSPGLSRDMLVGLVAYVLLQAIAADVMLGKPIHIAEVSVDSGYRELTPDGVRRVVAEVEGRCKVISDTILNPDWGSPCEAHWQRGETAVG